MENPKQPIHLQNSAFSAGYDLQNSPADLAVQYVAACQDWLTAIKLITDHLLRTIYSHIHDSNLTFDKLDRSEAAEKPRLITRRGGQKVILFIQHQYEEATINQTSRTITALLRQ
jgi:hypothetical protein